MEHKMRKKDPEIRITEEEINVELDNNLVSIKSTDLIENVGVTKELPRPVKWEPPLPTASQKESIDLAVLIDTSGSMSATDYEPNRLDAAKQAAEMFTMRKILQNYNDRISIIGFGGSPSVVHALDNNLEKAAKSIKNLSLTHTGTLLGPAILEAVRELGRFDAKRRAIVLLSDGGDEYDNSDPVKVAGGLKNIKIFTIGIGTLKGGIALLPHGKQQVFLNPVRLQEIAKITGGEYLYAPDVPKLQSIYLNLADY